MATTNTRTIKSSGGDYTSLSSWEAARQGDLVSLDTIEVAECYAFQDTTNVVISGWTTGANNYIEIKAATGEGHDGTWGTGYRLTTSAEFVSGIAVLEEFVRLNRIAVRNTNINNNYEALRVSANATTAGVRIVGVLAIRTTATGYGINVVSGNSTRLVNCVGIGNSVSGINFGSFGADASTFVAYNCVGVGTYGIATVSGTPVLKNCYAHGSTDAYSGTLSRTTCAHSSATSFSGSTANVAYSTATFTNVTSGSEDFELVSGSSLIDAGSDLSADGTYPFSTDMVGATRSGTWDIGPFNYAASSPTAPTIGTTTSITSTGVTINWTDNSSTETGFKVQYGVSSGGSVASWTTASGSPTSADATSLAITGLTPETTYKARVAATDGTTDSAWVETAEFTTLALVKKLRVGNLSAKAIGATGITGIVWASQAGAIAGAEIGEFSGGSIVSDGAGGAKLEIAVTEFGGSALTTSDTPKVLIRGTTGGLAHTTGIIGATVFEE